MTSNAPGGIPERLLDVGQALLLLAVPASGAWGLRRLVAGRRRRRADAELLLAAAEAARVALDATRKLLERTQPATLTVAPVQWAGEAAVLRQRTDDARNRLWVALGYPDPREEPITADEREVLAALGRTLRLRAREMTAEERAAYLEAQRVAMRRAAGLPDAEVPLFRDQGGAS